MLTPTLTPEQQAELLSRGTVEILPEGELVERLRLCQREGRALRVKQGFDPTAPDIHLGHAVGLRKLRLLQELGHQVVLIVGDYTGMVGDPSGLTKTRPQLSRAEIESNAATYLEQFFRVIERHPPPPRLPVEIHRNGEWFSKMMLVDVIRLASQYTVARLLERDDFAKRMAVQQPISLHELFYPLMQGHDSVAIRSDLELGGTEQKFNLLVGRALQEFSGQLPQLIMTLPLLPGTDGVRRMSKSLGNYVVITDPRGDMFGKLMSIPDSAWDLFWALAAAHTAEESRQIRRHMGWPEGHLDRVAQHPIRDQTPGALMDVRPELAVGKAPWRQLPPRVNPMQVKKRLAHRIVTMYHGKEAADQAQRDFEKQFSRQEIPDHLEEFGLSRVMESAADKAHPTIVDFLVASGISATRSAARRLLDQGAVEMDQRRVKDWNEAVDSTMAHIIRAGRRMKKYVPEAAKS